MSFTSSRAQNTCGGEAIALRSLRVSRETDGDAMWLQSLDPTKDGYTFRTLPEGPRIVVQNINLKSGFDQGFR